MKFHRDFFTAWALASLGLGLDMATGRSAGFFYAQMGRASWLGVLIAGVFFGLCMGVLSACGCRLGLRSTAELNGSLRNGALIRLLTLVVRIGAAVLLAAQAAHMGALALPVKHGALCGAGLALLIAAAAALTGRRMVLLLGAAGGLCLAAYLSALLFTPDVEPALRCALVLRLQESIPAAVLLALIHSALCACIASGAALPGSAKPLRLGVLSGLCFAALLAAANGVFARHEPLLLRLNLPFTSLASGWGSVGFAFSALLIFAGSTAALSALLFSGVSQRKSRFSGEN